MTTEERTVSQDKRTQDERTTEIMDRAMRELRERMGSDLPAEIESALRAAGGALVSEVVRQNENRKRQFNELVEPLSNREIGLLAIAHNDFTPGTKQWVVMCEAATRLIGEETPTAGEFQRFCERFKGTEFEPD